MNDSREGLAEMLVRWCDAYCRARGVTRSTLSTWIFEDGGRLDRIARGATLMVRTWEEAMLWLETNWPDGTARPAARNNIAQLSPKAAASTAHAIADRQSGTSA